jgi:hypothetical protein
MQILKDLYGFMFARYKDRRWWGHRVEMGFAYYRRTQKKERTVLLKEYKTRDGIEKSVMRGDKRRR